MAKFTDQEVPPELVALYDRLISNGKAGAFANNSCHVRKAAKKPKRPRKTPYVVRRLSAMVDILCDRLGLEPDSTAWRARHYVELSKLLDGVIDSDLWMACGILESVPLEASPENLPDPSPPPYAYRDVGNLPSLTTYVDGETGEGVPTYEGAHVGGYFEDTFWRWQRKVYALIEPITNPNDAAAFFYGGLDFQVDADARASKPMFSAMAKPILARIGEGILETVDAPRVGAVSLYWRYKIPDSDAPYFFKEYSRRVMILPRLTPKAGDSDPFTRAVLTIGPRPMFGRGFNNNQSVSVQMEEGIQLYQLNPCIGKTANPIVRTSSGKYGYCDPWAGTLVASAYAWQAKPLTMVGETVCVQTDADLFTIFESRFGASRTAASPIPPSGSFGARQRHPLGWMDRQYVLPPPEGSSATIYSPEGAVIGYNELPSGSYPVWWLNAIYPCGYSAGPWRTYWQGFGWGDPIPAGPDVNWLGYPLSINYNSTGLFYIIDAGAGVKNLYFVPFGALDHSAAWSDIGGKFFAGNANDGGVYLAESLGAGSYRMYFVKEGADLLQLEDVAGIESFTGLSFCQSR
jgi:hypothetical protein